MLGLQDHNTRSHLAAQRARTPPAAGLHPQALRCGLTFRSQYPIQSHLASIHSRPGIRHPSTEYATDEQIATWIVLPLWICSNLKLVRCPRALVPTLVVRPSGPCLPRRSIREDGSLIPFAPFGKLARGRLGSLRGFLTSDLRSLASDSVGAVFERLNL